MKLLKVSFRRDGLLYTLLKRNDLVSLFEIGGTYSDKTSFYEVIKIYNRNDEYGIRESLPSNEQFGRDLSRCFNDYVVALNYYDELTNRYLGSQKVVIGVRAAA